MPMMFSSVSSQPRLRAAPISWGGSLRKSGMRTSPREGNCHVGSASAVSSIGLDARLTTRETGAAGLVWSSQNALTHAGEASSKTIVSDFGGTGGDLLALTRGASACFRGGTVIELMTSPAFSPTLAAGVPGVTATTWVVTGKQ